MEKFLKLMTQSLDTAAELNADFPLENIEEWDSLGMVAFIGMASMEYHKEITLAKLASSKTINDLFKLVS